MTDSLAEATKEEILFTDYLLLCFLDFAKNHEGLRRGSLIAALRRLLQIAFCEFDTESSLDIKRQVKEIDEFCNHLKKYALRNTRNEQ